jgi:hypothetical protein
MGAKYGAYGTYTAAISGTVMGNFNCFSDQIDFGNALGINYKYIDQFVGGGYRTSPNAY